MCEKGKIVSVVFCYRSAGDLYGTLCGSGDYRYRLFFYRLVVLFERGSFCRNEKFPEDLQRRYGLSEIYHEHAAVHSGHNGGEDRLGASVRCHTEQKHQAEEFSQGCDVPASVLSVLVVGMVFSCILNPKVGFLNEFLRGIGLGGLTQQWLTNPRIAFFSVMMVDIWRGTGYIMTMLIVGILAIPRGYYEAASIDGASGWQKFRFITLPMLKQTLAVTIVLNVLYGLKVFDMVYAMTNGGPGHTTEVMYTAVFKLFSQGLYAEGTTMSSIMFVFMVIVGFFLIRVLTKDEVQE